MTTGASLDDRHGHAVAFIFARGGSKGVPKKNLRLVAGRSLIARSIRAAFDSSYIDTVIVSTDDDAIASAALREGAQVPSLRPAELATDDASEWLAWKHAVTVLTPEVFGALPTGTFVSVPTTAPLRSPHDIDRACERLWMDDVDIVISASVAKRHPEFNMVEVVDGVARLLSPEGLVRRRQDAAQVFDVTTVAYATTPSHILSSSGVFEGRVGVVMIPEERALDIDTEWDLHLADLVLRERENRQ